MTAKALDRFSLQAPAATVFVGLASKVLSDEALDNIFREHREHQVESTVLFSYLVKMLTPVVLGKERSVNLSHKDLGLTVSRQAIYDKLKGVEIPVSNALVQTTKGQFKQLYDLAGLKHKDIIPSYHTYILDGKTFNATEHRLVETRADARCPMPGRCVSLFDTRYQLFTDIEGDQNAFRCERKILEKMIPRLEERAIYVADRNFCDGILLEGFIDVRAYFIVRLHGACPARREIPSIKKKSVRSQPISERYIEVQLPNRGWTKVRLITVRLEKKTRNGDRVIEIVTNLPKTVSCEVIANAYRNRWTIENAYGYISKCFNAEIQSLCYPAAALLCFSISLLLFNVVNTIMRLMTKFGKQPKSKPKIELSHYYIAAEITNCYEGLRIAVDKDEWQPILSLPLNGFTKWLKQVAKNARLEKYEKNPRGPKKPPSKRKFSGARHVATQKLLDARK